ncbi:hypothetical protein B0I37DRAFT_445966 [Chaetomium sp. MPI-CAGE-AT-0009]|nr:hypothetical protein B0I37DRAFT_445966 [Chaetomium sp. MPI-CAGE-AT-0009]
MAWAERGIRAFTVTVVLVVLSTVFVALRFVSRGRILNVLGPTDWFMLLNLVFALANLVGVGIFAAHGLGHHITDFTLDQVQPFVKVTYVVGILTNTSIALTKLSVLLLLLDVLVVFWFRKATYVVAALATCYLLWVAVTNTVPCIPIQSFWDYSIPERMCFPQRGKMLADTTVNAALDVAIFCLPLPVLRTLTLPWRQKLWLCFVFALGILVCIASLLRFHFLDFTLLMEDPPWVAADISTWANVEINLAIIIACIPTLKPLVENLCPRLLGLPTGSGSEGNEDDDYSRPPTIPSPPCRVLYPNMEQRC